MPLIKLSAGKAASPDVSVPPTPTNAAGAAATPVSTTSLKLKNSAPPTPATEQPAQAYPKKSKAGGAGAGRASTAAAGGGSKKRPANDDTISPAAKRPTKPALTKKFSLKLHTGPSATPAEADDLPISAAAANKILLKRKSTQPKLRTLNVKRPPPPRLPGHGYDSEDSDAEDDPAVQQAFILRMEPGEDCDYIRDAIASGKIGLPPSEGPAEVSMKFIEKENRRAVVTVRGRMYAAVLVDLPCIVETMKSWDKKGWWKVADLCQMLLVLGRCSSETEAKTFPLPRDVDRDSLQYAHGLTPPMKWVRKRRFRKRLSYKTIANVEEEVERLLREDEQAEKFGGTVTFEINGHGDLERSQDPDQSQIDEDEEEDDAIETVENGQEYEEYYDMDDDMDDADLEGNLQAMFDEDHANASAIPNPTTAAGEVTQFPAPLADQGASFSAVENAMLLSPAQVETPAEQTPQPTSDEDGDSPDDDDDVSDEDADSPDVMDEDAAAKAAERNQQLEEVADLEKEVAQQRAKVESMKNQLLKERAVAQLRTLQEDLRVKKSVLGMGDEGDEDEGVSEEE